MPELSFNERQRIVELALQRERGTEQLYIADLYDSRAIYDEYGAHPGQSFSISYTLQDDGSVTFGKPVEVKRTVSYRPVRAKALMPVQAKAQTDDEAQAWLAGETPRRMLAIPFGGPIPSPKSERGVDLDGQWFSERTDLVGDYPALKATRDRLVDWHHSYAPVGGRGGDPAPTRVNMNGVAVGKAVLDDQPDEEGLWADFWLDAGQKRLSLVRRLVERGAQLFASAQPVAPGKADPATGEITYYPLLYMTVTTSPQNTLAVVTPKALLAELDSAELSVSPALRGLLAELDAIGAELPQSFRSGGDAAVKAGGVSTDRLSGGLSTLLAPLEELRDSLRAASQRQS